MKVKDLIEQLQNCDPELEVVCQKDAEGNGYSMCVGADGESFYRSDGQAYNLEVRTEECLKEEYEDYKDEFESYEDFMKPFKQCVVIWPV